MRLGVILAVIGVFSLPFTAKSANETAAGRTPAGPSDEYAINEDTALDLVWNVS
ncbi:MAG: hypothetical protein JSW52_04075 [Candidatus Coatesbacteria bacterium]|nr:MAG: hypothetical protein JSW52_04075 [Candidatus Coatesbacteria bacterium]